ncbi:hypothetical protein THAOC_15764 [Thalassiosira oceanica]|uniref:Uncharacterized protein n=1 Tax=Thalassiosira oceanica TaxID=159749 RepID=K0SDW9_THAOC|nr:hypothetical protein THAOC_15764 [Thalassiosira oceanica]|eukprot:EJK63570.1 hypothetical protein THAOC_15764 [Thalassiosira oceanica]
MKIEVPDRLAARPGDHGTGLGKARKASFHRKFATCLRRKVPPSAKRDPDPRSCRAGQTDEVLRMGRKVASWNRLVEIYKSLSIEEFRDVEVGSWGVSEDTRGAAAMSQDRRSSPGGLAKKKTRGMMTAASRKTPGVLRRVLKRTRGVLRRRQGRAETTPEGGGASSGDRVVNRLRAGDVISPPPASGGRRRSPSGLAQL